MSVPGTFHYCAFKATLLVCNASHLHHHLQYDTMLWGKSCLHHLEFFIADEDINPKDKEPWEDDEVSEDDQTVQISSISHVDVAPSSDYLLHPIGNHTWGECTHKPDNTFPLVLHQTKADKIKDALEASNDQAELLH